MAVFDISLPLANQLFGLSNVLIVVGAVFGLIGVVGSIWSAGVRDRFADQRISTNETLTASAQAEAAKANESTEVLRKANISLQADLERERAARLKIEGKIAPRHLTDAQKTAILVALKPFAGQSVDIVVPIGDAEAKMFAAEFAVLFHSAGWSGGEPDSIDQAAYTGPPPIGVQVTLNEGDFRAGKVPKGAEQLIQTLVGLGLSKHAFLNPQIRSGLIEFRVGGKEH